ncbi:hypothetical protein FSP39_007676 [Pinctada imbricata]|uniref:Uncharacterized protein n=1 Tax=Pinctada imbricata TaxID=66713 RepID=A0AA88Y5W9_PINIB|nr:hypothetical protein FSP39_007676 [Pinctada imbricata]
MKVAIILCVLVAGSQANFFDDLKTSLGGVGHAFTDTFHQVGEQAKNVGSQLLETAKQQGSQLASQALQSKILFYFRSFKYALFIFIRKWFYLLIKFPFCLYSFPTKNIYYCECLNEIHSSFNIFIGLLMGTMNALSGSGSSASSSKRDLSYVYV